MHSHCEAGAMRNLYQVPCQTSNAALRLARVKKCLFSFLVLSAFSSSRCCLFCLKLGLTSVGVMLMSSVLFGVRSARRDGSLKKQVRLGISLSLRCAARAADIFHGTFHRRRTSPHVHPIRIRCSEKRSEISESPVV